MQQKWEGVAGQGRGRKKIQEARGSVYRQLSLHGLPGERSAVTESKALTSVWLWLFFISYLGSAK